MWKAAGLFIIIVLSGYNAKAANCEVARYSTTIDVINNRIIQTDTVIIRINSRAGEYYSEISINYSHDNPVTGLKAWISDRSGTLVRYLKNKEITESNTISSSFYTDYFTKKFTLKHNEYPYFITYTFQTTEKQFLSVIHWHPVIGLEVPTLSASLSFRHPEDFRVTVIQNQIGNPEMMSSSGIVTQRWNASYDGTLRREVYCPDPWDYLPVVQIFPVSFHYGLPGSMTSWQTFGEWQHRLNVGLDVLPESEKTLIRSEILNLKDKKEIIKKLYYYLQDHSHYINVQIGIGGLKPYPASYVAQNKFGDCKALSIYMKALLNFAGIESYYALVNAGELPGKFYPEIPFQQFNHAMIAVPVDGDTLWLENTSNCLPFGYYGVFTQNRPALLINGSMSRLVNIPPLKKENVANVRKFHFSINEYGGTDVSAIFLFRGAEFEAISNLLINYNKEDQNEVVHKFLPFYAFDLYDWKIIRQSRDAGYIALTASAEINQIVNPIGDQFYFSFQPSQIPEFEQPPARKLPLHIPYPVVTYDTITYQLPADKRYVEIPGNKFIENKYGKYSIAFSNQGNLLTICRELELNPVRINPDEYPDFYNFIAYIKTQEKLKILFK